MVEAGGDGGDPPPLHWVVAVVLTVAARSFRVCVTLTVLWNTVNATVNTGFRTLGYWFQNGRILGSDLSVTGLNWVNDFDYPRHTLWNGAYFFLGASTRRCLTTRRFS